MLGMAMAMHIHSGRTGAKSILACAIFMAVFCFAVQAALDWSAGPYKIHPREMTLTDQEAGAIPQRIETIADQRSGLRQFSPRQSQSRRFHYSFDGAPLSDIPHTIWVPHSGDDTRLYFNNIRISPGVARERLFPGIGAEYASYDIQRFIVLPGRNRLNIYIKSDPTRSGLGDIFLGPRPQMQAAKNRMLQRERTLPKLALILAAIGLILNLLASLFAKSRAKFLFLSLGSAAQFMLFQNPHAAFVCVLAAAVIGYATAKYRHNKAGYVGLFFVGLALTGAVLTLLRISLPIALFDPSLAFALLCVGPLPLLLTAPVQKLAQVLQARRSRVEVLETALDDTRDNLEREIRRRAVFEERERLTRDIHDGVGGQLLGLLLRLRTGDLPKETITRDLQDGINDLRLVVDALDHTGNDLGRALKAFKDRAENLLDAAGLTLKWEQADDLDYEPQSRDAVLHLYRLLQEALNNVIRHAKADHVHIEIGPSEEYGGLTLSVLDNGIGRSDAAQDGNGTLNMRRRASLLGAQLIASKGIDGSGHGIRIVLP